MRRRQANDSLGARALRLPTLALCVLAASCAPHAPADADGTRTLSAALSVPGDASTLQAAIDAATTGEVIEIAAGGLQEDVVVSKKVTLKGASAAATVLYGTVTIDGVEGVTLEDLTLDGALSPPTAVGIDVLDAGLTLRRLAVRGFHTGVSLARSSPDESVTDSTFDRVELVGNSHTGLLLDGAEDLELTNSLLWNNGVYGLHATAGPVPSQGVQLFFNLYFANGFAASDGAGLLIEGLGDIVLTNSIAVSNHIGVHCVETCGKAFNLVWGNTQDYAGVPGTGTGSLAVDPRFVAPTEGDFRLLPDSPAVDAAGSGWQVLHDFDGSLRPAGDGMDMGPFELAADPPDASILITEVMANPKTESTGEYIELFNDGDSPVDLAGWIINDGDDHDTLTGWAGGPTELAPGSYAVVLDPQYPGTADLPADALPLTIATSLNLGSGLSTNDPVVLTTPDGAPAAGYSFPFDPGNGVSVELDVFEDGDIDGNWVAAQCGSTPGAPNCSSLPPAAPPTLIITEVMANPLNEATGEFVELFHIGGPGAPDIDLVGLQLSDGDETDSIIGLVGGPAWLAPGQYAVVRDPNWIGTIDEEALQVTVAPSMTLGSGLQNDDPVVILDKDGSVLASMSHPFKAPDGVSISRVSHSVGDVATNWVASVCASGSSPGAPNCANQEGVGGGTAPTVAVMEVMANALVEDTGEFVELWNFGAMAVDLAGFQLSDGDAEEPLQPWLNGGSMVLEPGARAVCLDAEYANEYGALDGALKLRTPDTSLGSGLSTTDPITLRGPDGTLIDSWTTPFNPGNGISAERTALTGGTWVASPCGASPGAANCSSEDEPAGPALESTSLVLSEVLANPLVEATGEMVELYNAGNTTVELAGLILDDGDAPDLLVAWAGGPTQLAPGGFALILDPGGTPPAGLAADVVLLTAADDATLGNGLSTNDPITLRDADGTAVATFAHPFNPGNGRSAEKLVPAGPDTANAWAASTCPSGASPGGPGCGSAPAPAGSLALGQTCPWGAIECASDLCVVLATGGAPMCTQPCGGGCPTGFACGPGGLCEGAADLPAPEVVINEVMYDGPGGDDEVFVELFGPPGTVLDGLRLVGVNGSNGNDYNTLNLAGVIGEDALFVVSHPDAPGASAAQQLSTKVNFQNGPDSIQLRSGDTVVDALAYGSFVAGTFADGEGAPAPDAGAGISLGRVPNGADSNDNATDFQLLDAPSPGLANDALLVEELEFSALAAPADVTWPDGKTVLVLDATGWTDTFGSAPPAQVDFATQRVVAFAEHPATLPGKTAKVISVTREASHLTLGVKRVVPADGCWTLELPVTAVALAVVDGAVGATSGTPVIAKTIIDCVADGLDEGFECGPEELCSPGLICAGMAAYGGWGMCNPAWMWGVFDGPSGESIPDAVPEGLWSDIEVSGLATVPEDVIARFEITHPDVSQLTVSLMPPPQFDGSVTAEAVLWDQAGSGTSLVWHDIVKGIPGDEAVNGTWTLRVVDHAAGQTGTLDAWSLELTSRWD